MVGRIRMLRGAISSGTRFAWNHNVALRALLIVTCLMAATGCGGIAEGRAPAPEPDDAQGSAGKASASDKPSDPAPDGDTPLGDCKLGPAEGTSSMCAWVADRRCYTTRDMACNCACPRSRDSLCLSGFDAGENAHVAVSCD